MFAWCVSGCVTLVRGNCLSAIILFVGAVVLVYIVYYTINLLSYLLLILFSYIVYLITPHDRITQGADHFESERKYNGPKDSSIERSDK